MARLIAEYLLHLASNPDAQSVHKSSVSDATNAMTTFGLDATQQATLLSNDPKQIEAAVQAELSSSSADADTPVINIPMQVHFPPGG